MSEHWKLQIFFTIVALCVVVVQTVPQLLRVGERVPHYELKDEDRKFISDPSANTDVFQKEGDMTFILGTNPFLDDSKEHTNRERRNAVLDPESLWPGATVPYEISSVFNEHEKFIILSAMHHWEENTCIRFRPKVSTDIYYIFVMSGPSGVCQSFVGRLPIYLQPQGLTLGPGGCVNFATVVHELGHAIGFYHEHNRPDRDEHIEIVYSNLVPTVQNQYKKKESGQSNLLGYGYDYASIMHYDKDSFSINNMDTIRAKDPTIPLGDSEELSPLDIAKAKVLYSCGPEESWPPLSTSVPMYTEPAPTRPSGSTCGQVSNGPLNGTFTSPGYPSYRHNLDCAYVVKVPKGYYIQFTLPNFAIEESTGCTRDYIQFYYGNTLDSENLVRYSGYVDGRICDSLSGHYIYSLLTDTATVFFHTDGSGSGSQGFQLSFKAIDENECEDEDRTCHQCTNFVGGFECGCNDGYYHSPAAESCYDVNECAYNNAGCQHKCINSGGSYKCECNSGYYLQADEKSCATTPQVVPPMTCGSNFTAATGTLQTPNWPQTYPNNIDCEWFIQLPDANKVVEISCGEKEPYGIAGTHPDCSKDYITFYDGHTQQSTSYGPYCGFTKPSNVMMSSNLAKVVFHAGPSHSSSRKGVQCTFRSVDIPTTAPPHPTTLPSTTSPPTTPPPSPTTPPSPQCGGLLNTASGSFQTPNWPQTYPNNIDCEWRIQLPDANKVVEIRCEEDPFGIAGSLPACVKDYLQFYDSHSKQDTAYGPFCHYTKPSITKMSSNKAMAVFHAGSSHNAVRKGFKCTFQSVDGPTTPPTQASQCGGTLTAASGSIQSPNWPQTYPVNVDCTWTITLPDSSGRVEITFESPFGIAGSLPMCTKDQLYIYDDNTGIRYGPYCFFTLPNPPTMSSNQARVVLHAGPRHSSSRVGFKANYRSV